MKLSILLFVVILLGINLAKQVYVALTDGNRVIIVKKRIVNEFWNNQHTGVESLVNQAGQWALPGGGMENSDESEESAGIRELEEETGIQLHSLNMVNRILPSQNLTDLRGFSFELVPIVFRHATDLNNLALTINSNLQSQNNRPRGTHVRDWELASAHIINIRDVGQYLGASINIPTINQNTTRQSINWYGVMAIFLFKQCNNKWNNFFGGDGHGGIFKRGGKYISFPVQSDYFNNEIKYLLDKTSNNVDTQLFLYETPTGEWTQSTIYKYDGFINGLNIVSTKGIGDDTFFVGTEKNEIKYGLVNIAAFLAQCMQETIRYDACDENNWDFDGKHYALSNACGQLEQDYQDYHCSKEEKHMECEVDKNLALKGTTHAKWWGAPEPFFCGPKTKYPFVGYWDHLHICGKNECKDYKGQIGGGENNKQPYKNRHGRTDVEGCCYWGRGVIQTTGICNLGKLNYYLGKKAADDGRQSLYPKIDFCKNPNAICQDNDELKWIAGFFYWMNAVQPYVKNDWTYLGQLKKWVDNGMHTSDTSFIDGVSGIVNRGCYDPPNCGTGEMHGKEERSNNFLKVINIFKNAKII